MKFLYDLDSYNEGVIYRRGFDPRRHPHQLSVGASNSGKTYANKLQMGHLFIEFRQEAELYICDFKGGDDFSVFAKSPRCFRYEEVGAGFAAFFQRFTARQSGQEEYTTHLFLYFDELASWLTYLPKKERDQAKAEMARLLMMGRAFNIHLIVAVQRADAELFDLGARDNFTVRLGLATLSAQSKTMLFPDVDNADIIPLGRGQGHLQVEGGPIQRVIVPQVRNEKKLEKAIWLFLSTGTG